MRRLIDNLRSRPEQLLAAATFATGLGLLAAGEAASRWLDPNYLERRRAASFQDLHRYSEVYGWDLRPGSRRVEEGRTTAINARGYRGREVQPGRSGAAARVLLLGDSITFGTYVGDGETFGDRLDAHDGFEVVNLAVQGYGPGQSLLKLEREGLAYGPDVVLFNLCLANDFADVMLPVSLYDGKHPKPFHRAESGQLVLHDAHVRLSRLQRAALALRESSHLYNRVASLLPRGEAHAAEEEHWTLRRAEAMRDRTAAVALTARIVARMRDLAAAHGARFVLVLHPDKRAFARDSAWVNRLWASPELRGVPILDLRAEYHGRALRYRDLMLDGLGHLSPLGHRAVAEILGAALRDADLSASSAPFTANARPAPARPQARARSAAPLG